MGSLHETDIEYYHSGILSASKFIRSRAILKNLFAKKWGEQKTKIPKKIYLQRQKWGGISTTPEKIKQIK